MMKMAPSGVELLALRMGDLVRKTDC